MAEESESKEGEVSVAPRKNLLTGLGLLLAALRLQQHTVWRVFAFVHLSDP